MFENGGDVRVRRDQANLGAAGLKKHQPRTGRRGEQSPSVAELESPQASRKWNERRGTKNGWDAGGNFNVEDETAKQSRADPPTLGAHTV